VKERRRSVPVIGIDGLGYMGLGTALGFVAKGYRVAGYDLKKELRDSIRAGRTPFHEVGFPELLKKATRSGRLRVVSTVDELAQGADGIFLCLPTPSSKSGRIDLRAVRSGATSLGQALRSVPSYRVVVIKSTVVPGTTTEVIEPLLRKASGKKPSKLGVAVNPEFLSEGSALRNATSPERIVLGTSDRKAGRWLREVYAPFASPIFELRASEAELVKYASNAFLAMKVSFANETSRMTEILGGNIDDVMLAVGKDSRIGQKFLKAGPGFGGSCFEKDVRALVARARELGVGFRCGEAALAVNQEQAEHVMSIVRSAAGPLKGKTVAVLGLAFKPGTDDIRESRAFPLVSGLVRDGAQVRVHDPVALANFRREWERRPKTASGSVAFSRSISDVLADADLAVIHADWPEYVHWRKEWTMRMRAPVLVDLRRSVSHLTAEATGLLLRAVGVGS
jgi:UDPglucose 6-dehydrogenase